MIGISAYFLKPGRVGGAEQMFQNLVHGFNEALLPLRIFANPDQTGRWPNRFVQDQLLAFKLPTELNIMIYPNYFTPLIPRRGHLQVKTVIHDLLFKDHPQFLGMRKRAWQELAIRGTLQMADEVIAISNFTAQSIERHFGRGFSKKIRVIPNPVYWPQDLCAANEPSPYILALASHYPHKNLETLVRGFALLVKRHKDLKLIIVGQTSENLEGHLKPVRIKSLVEALGLTGSVEIRGYQERSVAMSLLASCQFLAFPSLYEGFGLPPVEALGLGIPVLTTGRGSIPEVTLGLAQYVRDPMSSEEWAEMAHQILEQRTKFLPSNEAIQMIREQYNPLKIARLYGYFGG